MQNAEFIENKKTNRPLLAAGRLKCRGQESGFFVFFIRREALPQ
jgi:hypothetical protein